MNISYIPYTCIHSRWFSDADIGLEEFMTFQKKEHESLFGTPMDDFDLDLLRFKFQMLDADKSGSVDYTEYMKHQATKILGRKDKVCYGGYM